MAATSPATKLLPLHDLKNVNTVIGMLYDENGVYRAAFEPSVFYNTILLDSLKYGEENYVHLKYAENLVIRKGETTAKFRRWGGLTPTLTPLKEGVPPAPDKHSYETIEIGNIFSFGRWSEYTDRVNLSIVNEVIAERSVQYGEVANQTKELYARKTWLSSPNEFYANFRDFAGLGFGDEVMLDDLRFLTARMKRMQVKAINGKFNYICSPEFINGLIDDPRVKRFMEIEQTTGKLFSSGEPFPIFELEFVPTMLDEFAYPDTEYPGVYELADGKEVLRLYAIGASTYDGDEKTNSTIIYYLDLHQDFVVKGTTTAKIVASDTTYLSDGSAIEAFTKWELPIDATPLVAASVDPVVAATIQGSGAAITGKVTLRKQTKTTYADKSVSYSGLTDATASLAAINTLILAGGFMQLPVHRGILFGSEAMLKLNAEGISDQPQIIVKELGSSGVADALNQRQSVGFKVDGFGLAIKRPEAVCITYGIPKFAELAALTNKVISGDYILMDGRVLDDSYENHIATDGIQQLRVDGVNNPLNTINANDPNVNGTNDYSVFSAAKAYVIGNKVLYSKKPYVFIADHAAGAWNTAHVAKASDSNFLEKNPLDNGGNDLKSNVQ